MRTTAYAYQALPDYNAIRILELLPGRFDETISCTLRIHALQNLPAYEALPYVWDNHDNNQKIIVNGSNLKHNINKDDMGGCHLFNQADTAELSQQVAIMAQIYTSCEQVLVWLGTPTPRRRLRGFIPAVNFQTREGSSATGGGFDDSGTASALPLHFANNGYIYDIPGFHKREETDEQPDRPVRFTKSESFLQLWHGFSEGLQGPWWTRIWVVQEVLLPRPGTVHFGSWSIDWQNPRGAVAPDIRPDYMQDIPRYYVQQFLL
ncbi:hypothetical protein B0H66DRAFT_593096 [Apodospora peruviana]|uniref:Heterokaryon incompatibility domain-containing protein n=1 Tax=Apodospora peruviana TaxID=516989 RepID=A0AAE0M2L5_9PEZI|nr:hypothetical protein B0H66DRAFT_593096 [Apodospora peruviana]